MTDPTKDAGAGPPPPRIGWAVGAGAAIAGLAFYAGRTLPGGPAPQRRAGGAAGDESAGHAQSACHETDLQALHALQARHTRCALEARAIDHDLRGPVGAMAVALELLSMADDTATREEVVDVLQRQISRMTTLTQRVHELAQALAD